MHHKEDWDEGEGEGGGDLETACAHKISAGTREHNYALVFANDQRDESIQTLCFTDALMKSSL